MGIYSQARAEVAALKAQLEMRFPSVKSILAMLQKFVRADKAVVIGVALQALALLAAAFKFHVGAEGVAIEATVINIAVAYFLSRDFKAKLAAAKLSPKE